MRGESPEPDSAGRDASSDGGCAWAASLPLSPLPGDSAEIGLAPSSAVAPTSAAGSGVASGAADSGPFPIPAAASGAAASAGRSFPKLACGQVRGWGDRNWFQRKISAVLFGCHKFLEREKLEPVADLAFPAHLALSR